MIVRVVIVDDQRLFREGLRTVLSAFDAIEVVGEAENGAEAERVTRATRPDVVLMDLRMPVLDGVAATRRIVAASPNVRVLALTTFDDDETVFEALRAGAAGYLLKDASAAKLVEAIQAVASGASYLGPSIAAKVVAELARQTPRRRDPAAELGLSPREVEVLALVGRGASNKEIAVALRVAEGTVKNHLTNVFTKLGVQDRVQAALRARELGLT